MSTLAARLEGDGQARAWIREHLDYPHDWCLIWPFSRIQSGYATFGSEHIAVHRFMCEHRNGLQPADKPHAAHSCGRGHDGCVNPKHLDWKTISENQLDRYMHSGPTKRAKLTPEEVDEILALKGRSRVRDIAEQFGVSDTNIRSIHAGRLWKETSTRQTRVFNEDEVNLIRATPWQVKSANQFAKEFGVHRAVIDRIRGGKTYKWANSDTPTTQLPSTMIDTPSIVLGTGSTAGSAEITDVAVAAPSTDNKCGESELPYLKGGLDGY